VPSLVVEDCLTLDAAYLAAQGAFKPGARGTLAWGDSGCAGAIAWSTCGDGRRVWGLALNYRIRQPDGSSKPVSYIVPVRWQPGTKGGSYALLECPGHACDRWECQDEHCGRSARLLRQAPGSERFLCRQCLALPYRSQRLNPNHFRGAYWRLDQVTRRAARVGKRGPGQVAKRRLLARWEAARTNCRAILGRDLGRLDARLAALRKHGEDLKGDRPSPDEVSSASCPGRFPQYQ
jgi:hypothetical protein